MISTAGRPELRLAEDNTCKIGSRALFAAAADRPTSSAISAQTGWDDAGLT